MKGDDYILYAHPEDQKTPKAERLRKWYTDIIEETVKDGIVAELTNLFDEHMNLSQEGEDIVEATRLPYMDGDYWPGVAEDIIADMDREEKKERYSKGDNVGLFLKNIKKPMTVLGPFNKRVIARSKDGNNFKNGFRKYLGSSDMEDPVSKV